MKHYIWDPEKNERLKRDRGISFERVVLHIEQGDLLDILEHPNFGRYPDQRLLIVRMGDYVFVVPSVADESTIVLKTIFPSRKLTKQYIRE